MKFLFLVLLATSAYANDVKVCQDFMNKVLTPSITFVDGTDDHGYRFVKSEKEALKSINKYDSSKLSIADEVAKASNEMNDCKYIYDPKFKQDYCPGLFENYHFFQGLMYGMKNYGWSKSTIESGKEKLFGFIKETTIAGIPLIHVALSYALLEDFATKFPNDNISLQEVKQDRAELERTIQRARMKAEGKSVENCEDVQSSMKRERKEADLYRNKLLSIISKKK